MTWFFSPIESTDTNSALLSYKAALFHSRESPFRESVHKEKELNDFGLKIMIFDISKIQIFEKIIFTGNCSCDLKISSVKIF